MAKRVEDLVAYQLAIEFKLEVQELIAGSSEARGDWKFRKQLQNAASGIDACQAEGFARDQPAEFVNFLRYALASLAEAKTRIKDGVLRGYFRESSCERALIWAERCRKVTVGLLASQRRLAAEHRRKAKRRPRSRKSDEQDGPGRHQPC